MLTSGPTSRGCFSFQDSIDSRAYTRTLEIHLRVFSLELRYAMRSHGEGVGRRSVHFSAPSITSYQSSTKLNSTLPPPPLVAMPPRPSTRRVDVDSDIEDEAIHSDYDDDDGPGRKKKSGFGSGVGAAALAKNKGKGKAKGGDVSAFWTTTAVM